MIGFLPKSITLAWPASLAIAMLTCAPPGVAVAQQVLKWSVEATVTEIFDPDMIWDELRLGDPVYGTISYDLSTAPEVIDATATGYFHPLFYPIATMTVENPRTNEDVEFIPAAALDAVLADVIVLSDDDFLGTGELFDSLAFEKSAARPLGFTGPSPAINVFLLGPSTTRSDNTLSTELSLDDWPDAFMLFGDAFDSEGLYGSIVAEIHTLTPVAPGDFNGDGEVNADDYRVWAGGFGSAIRLDADANANGVVDAADYVIWRNNTSQQALAGSATLPEPTSSAWLGFVSLACLAAVRRLGARRPCEASIHRYCSTLR
jgi:hypothetical protein